MITVKIVPAISAAFRLLTFRATTDELRALENGHLAVGLLFTPFLPSVPFSYGFSLASAGFSSHDLLSRIFLSAAV
jgi:hypothetical protein